MSVHYGKGKKGDSTVEKNVTKKELLFKHEIFRKIFVMLLDLCLVG